MTKKILIAVFSLIAAAAFAFTITWGVINFNKVKEGMSGTGLYTKEDLNKANEDGYNSGLKDKEEYIILIDGYRDTIATLNDKVSQLNFQVNNLTSNNADYKNQVNDLTAKKAELEDLIAKLQSSIAYYETYVATLESDTQAVATYEYDGSIYAIQIMNKGTTLSITDPVDTDRQHFNGWKVNGVLIDKNTYVLTQNTKFVADITYSFAVNFMVDKNSYNSQFVVENQSATRPSDPVKDGYEFLGWSKNGVDVIDDISTIPVTEDTTYVALFKKLIILEEVNFSGFENSESTLYARNIWSDGTDYYYSHLSNQYKLNKETQVWLPIVWNGSYMPNGEYIWIEGDNVYYSYPSLQLKLNKSTNTWEKVNWKGLENLDGRGVWTDNKDIYYSSYKSHYKLNRLTNTWEAIIWQGIEQFGGDNVWTDGLNFYVSQYDIQYKLNFNNYTVTPVSWNGWSFFYGRDIFTIGNRIFLINQYNACFELDISTNTWERIKLNIDRIDNFSLTYTGFKILVIDNAYYYVCEKGNDKLGFLRIKVGAVD